METQSGSSASESSVSGIDPNFKDESAQLPPDLISDWLPILMQENRRRMEQAEHSDGFAMKANVVNYVFTVALRLRLPREVKFIALQVLERFMANHVRGLYRTIYEMDQPEEVKLKKWERIEANISRQLPLRVVSALQIASKLHSYHESLSTKQARNALISLGQMYTADAVFKSEIRVLSEADFGCHARLNPTAYLESFFKVLCMQKKGFRFNEHETWNLGNLFLDCAFLKSGELFDEVVSVMHPDARQPLPNHERRQKTFAADYALIAMGCLLAACVALHGEQTTCTELLPALEEISQIPEDDMRTITLALTNMAVHSTEKRDTERQANPVPDFLQGTKLTPTQVKRMHGFADADDRVNTTL